MSPQVDISLLSFDVSHNCLGRAHLLAEILSRRFEVEIVGPATSPEGVWFPCRDSGIPVRWFHQERFSGRSTLNRLLSMAEGEVLYAVKPRATSFGVGLLGRRRQGKPLVVDIDDWELGFYLSEPGMSLKEDLRRLGNPNNLLTTWAMEKLVSRADAVTVTTSYLRERFGGILIPHCRDTARLDPAAFDRAAIREERGWADDTVAIFLGTPAVHKGMDVLLEAVQMVRIPRFRLVIAGVAEDHPLWRKVDERSGAARVPLELTGNLPLAEVPQLLAGADIAVVPQLAVPASRGQFPAKIIDAMAMARSVVASAVSDIPEILDGCGLLCRPGDPVDLAAKLTVLAEDPVLRETLGAAARRRCLDRYSYDSVEQPLVALFERVGGLKGRAA